MHREDPAVGWASRSLEDSLQRSEALGIGCWQFLALYAVLVSDVAGGRVHLIVAHLVIVAVAGVILALRVPAWPLLVLVPFVLVLDYRAVAEVNTAMWIVCFWTSGIFTGMPFVILRPRRAAAFALLTLVATIVGLTVWHAGLEPGALLVPAVSAVALAVACTIMMITVRRFARSIDVQHGVVRRERDQLELRQAVMRTAAEDARIMHDTLINTLSLIASGSTIVHTDVSGVRDRCRRDADAVDALLDGLDTVDAQTFHPRTVVVPQGIELHRTGLDDDVVAELFDQLPTAVSGAVRGAVQELVRNAVKHAGVDWVELDVQATDDLVTVTVADRGRGFDGRLIKGRGLAESVVARSRQAGVDVKLRTAPGDGTTASLLVPRTTTWPAAGTAPHEATDAHAGADRIIRTAGWRWGAAVTGFGVVNVVIRPLEAPWAAYAMLAVVGGLTGLAWWICRERRTMPAWLVATTLLAIPVAFVLGLVSTDFGRADLNDWPTLSLSALPVLLLVTLFRRWAFVLGNVAVVVTAVVATIVEWRIAPASASTLPIAAAIPVVAASVWVVLHRGIFTIGLRHQQSVRQLGEERFARAVRDQVGLTRARWTTAGVRRAVAVVRRIADGTLHPADPDVRRECAAAERQLRQLLQLNPDTVHMSTWLAQALAAAGDKAVTLTVRGASNDAPTAQIGEAFGRVILDAVEAVPPGDQLSLALFPSPDGPQLLLVGPHDTLSGVAAPESLPAPYRLDYRGLGEQDLVEVSPHGASHPPAGVTGGQPGIERVRIGPDARSITTPSLGRGRVEL